MSSSAISIYTPKLSFSNKVSKHSGKILFALGLLAALGLILGGVLGHKYSNVNLLQEKFLVVVGGLLGCYTLIRGLIAHHEKRQEDAIIERHRQSCKIIKLEVSSYKIQGDGLFDYQIDRTKDLDKDHETVGHALLSFLEKVKRGDGKLASDDDELVAYIGDRQLEFHEQLSEVIRDPKDKIRIEVKKRE